MKSRTGSD